MHRQKSKYYVRYLEEGHGLGYVFGSKHISLQLHVLFVNMPMAYYSRSTHILIHYYLPVMLTFTW